MADKEKRIFVTVGTTEFESLVKKVTSDEALQALAGLGFTDIKLQIGHGKFEPLETDQSVPRVTYFRLKDSIAEDIAEAHLVISHAGAGSVLDCLNAGKRLLVVINDELMGNHQVELAEKLAEEKHLHYCTVSELVSCLATLSWDAILPFPPGKPEKLTHFLNDCFGLS